jgi:multidrug efflux system membrane fusion protein
MAGRGKAWLWFGAAAAMAAAVAYFVLDRPEKGKPAAPPPAPVLVAQVRSGDVPIELDALGRVSAYNTVTVRAMVGGQIKRIAFADGQVVAANDTLVQIDPRPFQATVDQDKATVDRDRASLANAESDLRRYGPLLKQGVTSQQQVETQKSLVSQLRATVAADLAALARDQVQLSFTTVAAPIAGVLGLRLVDAGNVVSPSDPTGLVVLTQVQPIAVLFTVPQSSLSDIRARQAAAGDKGLAVEAWTQDGVTKDGARKLGEGWLEALSNQVDATSGTLTLKAAFPNTDRALWPGASVLARLVLDTQQGGLTVPSAALDQGPQGPFVWLVGDGTVKTATVQVRQIANGRVLVSQGLQAGQMVVTDGQYGLSDGAHVTVQQAGAEQAGAEQADATPLRRNGANRLGISP